MTENAPPGATAPPDRIGLSSGLYVAVVIAAVGDAVLGWPMLRWIGIVATVVFLAIELRRVPMFQISMAAVLLAVGLGVGATAQPVFDVLVAGLAKAQLFLVLFFAIMWLQTPAAASPALQAVQRTVVSQPPGRRFLYLAASAHLLGAVLNVAGLVLLSTMVERQKDPVLQRRMASALMQSYVVAAAWSPFFVGVVVILIALPELDWSDAVSGGMPLAIICIACAWGYDRLRYRRPAGAAQTPTTPAVRLGAVHVGHLVAVFGSLIVAVIGTVEWTGQSLPVVLGFVAPPFGMAWMAMVKRPTVGPRRCAFNLARSVIARAAGLRSEALAFTASSIVGVGIAAGFPTEALSGLADGGGWIIAGLVFGVLGLGFLGMHPLVPVIIVAEALPPDVLGLPVKIVGMCLLGAWGLTTLISPVSGTTLMMSRFVPVSSYVIAWRWNPPFTVLAAAAVTLFVYGAWRMELY